MVSPPLQLDWPLTSFQSDQEQPLVCGPISPSGPAPGVAILWTADDTEQRLLGDLPPQLAFLVCCGTWTAGCEFRPPTDSITSIDWKISADRSNITRPALAPQPWTPLSGRLESAFKSLSSAMKPRNRIEATALEAGLRQLHGDLDGSHRCAQSIEGEGRHHGDYWHAIMHRREPDYGNSKYWFRRVGRHPIFPALAKETAAIVEPHSSTELSRWLPKLLAGGAWDAMAFVDCAEAAAASDDSIFRRVVEEIQYREMLVLFAQTFRDAL